MKQIHKKNAEELTFVCVYCRICLHLLKRELGIFSMPGSPSTYTGPALEHDLNCLLAKAMI